MTLSEKQIADALRQATMDQPGVIEMAASNFRGRNRFMSIVNTTVSLVMLGVMAWCAVRFFKAVEMRDMIMYAVIFLYLSGAVMMLKLWFWLMMIRYSIVREIKRIELNAGSLNPHDAATHREM